MTNEEQITHLIENWALAVRNRDIEGILANHSSELVMFDVPPPFVSKGLDAYRKTWDVFFTGTKPGVFDIGHMDIKAGDDVAFCFATMKCSENSDDGEFKDFPFRLTIGLEKNDGQWMIVHEHHSVPAN